MTLPSTGPLSLSALQTEFGGTNPISFSEYYAGAGLVAAGVAGVGGAIPFSGVLNIGSFRGSPAGPVVNYWITESTNALVPNRIAVDPTGTFFYTCSTAAATPPNKFYLAKHDVDGAVVWQKTLSAATALAPSSVSVSDSIVYASANTSTNFPVLQKYDTDGNLQWQKGIALTGSNYLYYAKITQDPVDGSFYLVGLLYDNTAVRRDFHVSKYDSAGVLLWKLSRRSTTTMGGGISCIIGPDSQIYAYGGDQPAVLIKLTPAGAITWERTVGSGASSTATFVEAVFDSAGTLYCLCACYSTVTATNLISVIAYNSSGTELWNKYFGETGVDFYPTSISYHAATDKLYVVGSKERSNSVMVNDIFILSLSTAGAINWSRKIARSGSVYLSGYHAALYGDALYIAGSASNKSVLFKLPVDGSRTGTYGLNTYATITISVISGSLTGTLALSAVTPTLTVSASAHTSADTTEAFTLTTI